MARNKKRPDSGTRDSVAESPSDAVIQDQAGGLDIGREDSDSGAGEEIETGKETFPIKLVNPGGQIFKPYGEAAEDFQRELSGLTDVSLSWLTITRMTVPSIDAPAIHKTPYCGFPVDMGDEFSVQLNDARIIKA